MASTQHIEVDLTGLSVGCLYLLTNQAVLTFPTSTRAHPSFQVMIDRGAAATRNLYRQSDRVYFPFFVNWNVWHEAVVPVLLNKDVQVMVADNPSLRVHPNLTLIVLEDYDGLLDRLSAYLIDSLIAAGFLPPETDPFHGDVLEAEANAPADGGSGDGDPIVPNPDTPAGTVDLEFYHSDGTLKLSYNVVDA